MVETISESSDAELFWAIRGGGGNFGIATRFRYRLQPVDMVTGGALFLPLPGTSSGACSTRSLEAPDELTQITFVMNLPPAPFVPAELVGTPAVIVMPVPAGPLDEGGPRWRRSAPWRRPSPTSSARCPTPRCTS